MTAKLSNTNTPKEGLLGSLLNSKSLLNILEKNLSKHYSGSPGLTTTLSIPAEKLIDIAKNTADQINSSTLSEEQIISEATNDPSEISETNISEAQNQAPANPELAPEQNSGQNQTPEETENSKKPSQPKNNNTAPNQETPPSEPPTEAPEAPEQSQAESPNKKEPENTPQAEPTEPDSETEQPDNPQQPPSESDSPNQETPQNGSPEKPTNEPQTAPPENASADQTPTTPNNVIPFPQNNVDDQNTEVPQPDAEQTEDGQEEPDNNNPDNIIPFPPQQDNPNQENSNDQTKNEEPKEKSALEEKGGEVGKELGGEAGKVAGQEIGGPIGGAVGDYIGGKIGEKSGENAGKKINDIGEEALDTAKDKAENLINPDFQDQENQNASQLGKDKTQSRRRNALEDVASTGFDPNKFIEQEGLEDLKHKNALGDKATVGAEGVGKKLGAELLHRIKTGSFRAFIFAFIIALIKDAWDIIETFIDGGIFASLLNVVISSALAVILFTQFGWMKRIIIQNFLKRFIIVVLAEFIPVIGFVPFYTILILYIKRKADQDLAKHQKAWKKLEKSFGDLEKKSKQSQKIKKKINLQKATIAKRSAQVNQQTNQDPNLAKAA